MTVSANAQSADSSLRSDQVGAEILSLSNVVRRYPGMLALSGVDLDVRSGEVHAVIGENGAGKSTLIRMVTGAERPDEGRIRLFGQDATQTSARDRLATGVGAIYQELSTVPAMTALANVFLDAPPRRGFVVDRQAMRGAYSALAERLGVSISPGAVAGGLSVADRQMIEIMRALRRSCRLLIMDEPTAALGPEERERLFAIMKDLRSDGTGIIYVSHDLDEVLRLSDRITVLRNGRVVASGPVADWTKAEMVRAMVGHTPPPATERAAASDRAATLRVSGLHVPGQIDDLSFEVRPGEILGIAGLVGSGRSEVLRAIAGVDERCTGRIEIAGQSVQLPWDIQAAMAARIGFVPEDRKADGIVPLMPSWQNCALTDLGAVSRLGIVNRDLGQRRAGETSATLGFESRNLDRPIGTLSGGNQQKIVLAKWLRRDLAVLLLDEPTRGVDIGARAEIYREIRARADAGLAIVLVSSDLEEVIEHADRILVLARQRQVAMLAATSATPARILSMIFETEEETP